MNGKFRKEMANFGTHNKKMKKILQLTTHILRFTIGI